MTDDQKAARERDDLKAFAEAATAGPWKADGTVYEHMAAEVRCTLPGSERGIAQVWNHDKAFADARFMAAANPTVILALLSDIAELVERVADVRHDYGNLDREYKAAQETIADLTAERDALAARVAVLEGQGEPVAWVNPGSLDFLRNCPSVAVDAYGTPDAWRNQPLFAHPTPEALARAERAEAFIRSLPGVCDSFCDCDGDQVAGEITARVEEFLDALSPSPATQTGE
jgi:hypothetical protein